MVEWLAVNQHVTGSSPVGGVLLFSFDSLVVEWLVVNQHVSGSSAQYRESTNQEAPVAYSRKNSCASSESVNVHSSPPSLVTLFALPVFHNLILENDGAPERRWLTARGIPGGRGRKPCPYCCRFAPTIPPRRLRMIVATAVEITVAKGVAKRSGVIITPILGFIFGIEGFKGD